MPSENKKLQMHSKLRNMCDLRPKDRLTSVAIKVVQIAYRANS